MYKYSEEQEEKIRQDREELKRLDRNRRKIQDAARGGPLTIPGDVLERAKEELQRCEKYIAGLDDRSDEKTIFYNHYVKRISLSMIGYDLGRSDNSCRDIIKRQLARRSLDGQSGEQSERRTYRPRPQRRRKGE